VSFRSRAALLALLIPMCWFGVASRSPEGAPSRDNRRPTVGEESAVSSVDWRISLHSLSCKDDLLEGVFRIECLDREGPHPGPDLHPWGGLYVVFYDAAGVPITPEVFEDFIHDLDFLSGKANKECVAFSAQVPAEARYVSVQYGTSKWFTKKAVIPREKE
jgi:hypothetical protein